MKARIPNAQGGNMMKKIQEIQENMTAVQNEVYATEFSSTVAAEQLKLLLTAYTRLPQLSLNPRLLTPKI